MYKTMRCVQAFVYLSVLDGKTSAWASYEWQLEVFLCGPFNNGLAGKGVQLHTAFGIRRML